MTSPIRSAPSSDKPRFVEEWVRLGDVATYINGYAFKPSDYSDTGLPIIRIQDLTGNAYQTNRYEGILPERYAVDDGDILISWSASLGVFEWNGGPAWLNQHIFKVSFDKMQVDKRFFAHQARFLVEASANLAHGATMRHLTKKVFDSLPFYFPRSERQRAIADQLDGIDMQLCNATNQLYQLDSLVKSRFVEMFGDPCDPANDSFPREPIDSFCELRTGPFGSSLHKEDYVSGGHPIVNPSHITESKIEIDSDLTIDGDAYAALTPYHLNIGDVVMGRRGEIGRCAVVAKTGLVCGTGSMILRPNPNRCHSDFLQRVISFPSFALALEREAVGVTMKNLNAKIVGNATVILPPIKLQQDFDAFVAQANKLRFAGNHEMNFRCERFTLSWSTMA